MSFWDNSFIVEYTCKLFLSFWKKIVSVNHTQSRSSFEKVLDYFFIKRYNTYFEFLGEQDEESNIKLSVLEILTNYLNELIQNHDFILITYSCYDFSKIRYNLTLELLMQIHKYFNLTANKFSYIKKLLTITFLKITNQLLDIVKDLKKEENVVGTLKIDQTYIDKHLVLTEYWEDIIKKCKLNKPKKLIEKANQIYKGDLNDKEKHKAFIQNFAKSVSFLLKYSTYVDIENIFEILGGKEDISKVSLMI